MSTTPLLTIGAFAKAVELAPSTLRYYDDLGLLPPAEVDPDSGYRYYTPELERRAHVIRRMREIGVPIETMRAVLEGPRDSANRLLRDFARDATDRARRACDAVEEVLASLERDAHEPSPSVVTVHGTELAAALRRVSRAADRAGPLAGVLMEAAADGVTVVATDRYWMACWTVPVLESQVPQRRAYLPTSHAADLAERLTPRCDVTVEIDGSAVRVRDDTDGFDVPVADDRFPAYRLVLTGLPQPSGRATVRVADLAPCVDPGDETPVRLSVGPDRILVSRLGDSEGTRLDAIGSGRPATLWFTPRLLSAALETMVGADVTLSYAAPDQPVRLTPVEQRRLDVVVTPCSLEP